MKSIAPGSNRIFLLGSIVLERSLAQLSFEHCSVLVLHDLHDLPQKEAAAILGVPVGTVNSRLTPALL
ncbi:MAG: sigma factor-like helix-turn-helix DNA-binding protein [Oscillatoriaceae cyanobacterium SKYGB_i_bin93]|nr:sigma factor-like helix-turn-helix DNA-binding protein [Oscillatoriaceae cyanobacterium SKYGB_i_bin93]